MAFYYAVQKGKKPGVYNSWDECKAQVTGFSGAVYKKFSTRAEAETFAGASGGYAASGSGTSGSGSSTVKSGSNVSGGASRGASLRASSGGYGSGASAGRTSSGKTAVKVPSGPQFKSVQDVTKDDIIAEFSDVDTEALAYVDGSYNVASHKFGYGGILMRRDGTFETVQGAGTDPSLASMRNVAGEIHGSMAAISKARDLGIASITVFYDYMGIEMWANGQWKANKEGTIEYKAFIREARSDIDIRFRKVAAHTGVRFNELVDKLAKGSVGIL